MHDGGHGTDVAAAGDAVAADDGADGVSGDEADCGVWNVVVDVDVDVAVAAAADAAVG